MAFRGWCVVGAALAFLGFGAELARAQQLSYYTVIPCRLLDSRDPAGLAGGPALQAGAVRTVAIAGRCGVFSSAKSVSLNVTITGATASGHVTLYAAGSGAPATSSISVSSGVTRANSALVAIGEGGAIAVQGNLTGGQTNFIIDVNGYFVEPAVAQATGAPVMNPPPGAYFGIQNVTLTSSTAGAVIRYTTDGSTPNGASPLYSAPIVLGTAGSSTIRAFATSGLAASPVANGTYVISLPETVYLATLTSQCVVQTLGSGNASLVVSGDETTAKLSFQFSNLTGNIIAKHIHAPDTLILFDLDTATPDAMGTYHWTIAQAGTWTPAQIRNALHAGQLYLNLHTAQCPNGEIKGQLTLATGGQTFTPPPAPPALPPTGWTNVDAARFFAQTTFGPQPQEIDTLASQLAAQGQVAFQSWITWQMGMAVPRHIAYLDALVGPPNNIPADELYSDHFMESIWNRALYAPDQLRQRVALALSEIFVISDVDGDLWGTAEGMATYMDHLQRGAFGNFRTLLQDVTLSPAMGVYLDMLSNDRADPDTGLQPNENFAREILQLFSIGLYQLHPDGSLRFGADGLPIATYGQEEIKGFARVFTGWTHPRHEACEFLPYGAQGGCDWHFNWPRPFFREAMQPWEAPYNHHETGTKLLLDGFVQPANQGAVNDLNVALNQIFNHPNVGPFICKQLIQRLVTSNPSPAYVYRCGQAFANNGGGVRGDMSAVVRTILLDYEARSRTVAAQPGFGKLKEPIVRFGGLMRSLAAVPSAGDNRLRYYWLDSPEWGLGQNPLRSPTVFNFFEPTYAQPGAVAQAGLTSPEFKITTETTVFGNPNFLSAILDGWMYDPDDTPAEEELFINWTGWLALTDAQVVDRINLLFFGGGMTPETRTILLTAYQSPDLWPPPTTEARRIERLQTLIWLTFMSPESLVQR